MNYLGYLDFLCSRAIDIQGLVGNVGGYIGLFLGYSFLQIPDVILFIVLKAKRWLEQIREGRDQNKTKPLKIMVHENISASQGISKRESNNGCEESRLYVDINAHNELIARIEHLENQQGQLNAHLCR